MKMKLPFITFAMIFLSGLALQSCGQVNQDSSIATTTCTYKTSGTGYLFQNSSRSAAYRACENTAIQFGEYCTFVGCRQN